MGRQHFDFLNNTNPSNASANMLTIRNLILIQELLFHNCIKLIDKLTNTVDERISDLVITGYIEQPGTHCIVKFVRLNICNNP